MSKRQTHKLWRDISVQYGTWLSYAVLHGSLKRVEVWISLGNHRYRLSCPLYDRGVGGGVGPSVFF